MASVRKLPTARGQRVIILHAGGSNGWVDCALFLACKKMSVAAADYHYDMDSGVFEDWFENKLIPGLPPNSVIVLDNAAYHSRQSLKIPNMGTKKSDILHFMMKKQIPIPSPVPKKEILLGLIKKYNLERQYVVDDLAVRHGHTVLRLPPYFCIFNPIELLWGIIKCKLRKMNTDPFNTNNVCEIIRNVYQ